MSDLQITVESDLIDLLEQGDEVLADKGFPEIRQEIERSGKCAFIVMPPFLQENVQFTGEEVKETYSIASVRIHVEGIMQRIRIYKILDKITTNLLSEIDAIFHVCCVLVNFQPPIISDNTNDEDDEDE